MAFSLFLLATELFICRGWPRRIYLWLPFCGLVASFRWLLLLGRLWPSFFSWWPPIMGLCLLLQARSLLLLAGSLPFVAQSPFVVRMPSFDLLWPSFVDWPPIVGYDLLLWAFSPFSLIKLQFMRLGLRQLFAVVACFWQLLASSCGFGLHCSKCLFLAI